MIVAGKWMAFRDSKRRSMYKPVYDVLSRRGGFTMGTIEFRNQWQAWSFKPHHEAVFNRESLAEVFCFLRDQRIPAELQYVEHTSRFL